MARLFFIASIVASVLISAVMLGKALSGQAVPESVSRGYAVWQNNGCVGCHTIYGQGGSYAPDLTHIYSQRGDGYIREFLVNPNAFHPDQRLMPRFGLTVLETDNLLSFLNWVGTQDAAGTFPPRMIVVSGTGANVGLGGVVSNDEGGEDTPVARGRALFSRSPAICSTCHSLEPDIVIVGPSLYGIVERAALRVSDMSAEEYIRNSILYPSDYIVEGFSDVMQKNFADVLTSQEINDLIAFLLSLEANPQ